MKCQSSAVPLIDTPSPVAVPKPGLFDIRSHQTIRRVAVSSSLNPVMSFRTCIRARVVRPVRYVVHDTPCLHRLESMWYRCRNPTEDVWGTYHHLHLIIPTGSYVSWDRDNNDLGVPVTTKSLPHHSIQRPLLFLPQFLQWDLEAEGEADVVAAPAINGIMYALASSYTFVETLSRTNFTE